MLSPAAETVVTEAELLSHGIDPRRHFGDRVPTYPLDVRCGDDRYIRTASGCVTKFYGYYDPVRVRLRQSWTAQMARDFAMFGF